MQNVSKLRQSHIASMAVCQENKIKKRIDKDVATMIKTGYDWMAFSQENFQFYVFVTQEWVQL